MIITLVTDQFYQCTHGTSVSAQQFHDGLVKLGHTVRVLAIDDENNTAFALKERNFGKPINKILHSQGFQPAKPDRETIAKAVEGADIVHIYLPFKLGYKTIEVCREMNIPCTAAFHILPENITSTLHMEKLHSINYALWKKFYNTTYRYVKHIHCPSLIVAKELKKRKYNAKLHVISNGFNEIFKMEREAKPAMFKDRFIIVATGRFSQEKRYDLLIKAVKQSKYKDKIQLVLGGRGPLKKKIMKMSRKLPIYPVFLGPYNRQMQISFLNFADLYVHCADTEVEGMTCIEAIACGCVPIVSNSEKSATPQFVVNEHSIFEHGNAKSLASQIDWWLDHPEELKAHQPVIAEHAQKFAVSKSMEHYVEMFKQAIEDWDPTYDGKSKNAIPAEIINKYEKN